MENLRDKSLQEADGDMQRIHKVRNFICLDQLSIIKISFSIVLKYVEDSIEDLKTQSNSGGQVESILEKLQRINKKVAVIMTVDSLLGGVQTTSASFVGVLYCLAKNQDKQDLLREELRSILPDKDVALTPDKMRTMPYLRACIKEGMRLYSTTVGNMRRAGQDLVLSGFRVPKGTEVVMGASASHADESQFYQARKFIPERWLKENASQCPFAESQHHPFAFVPFGFGPRMCIGRRFAEHEMEVLLISILREYKVEWFYPEMKVRTTMFTFPDDDLKFRFTEL